MDEFERIYRTYFRDVYRYVKSLSQNEDIAEEITAEAFFKAMKSLNSFQGTCDIRIWLCQIARNCYFSYLRKNKRHMLRVFGELSFKQIAQLFKKNENWACVTFHRAKAKIKEKMEDNHENNL